MWKSVLGGLAATILMGAASASAATVAFELSVQAGQASRFDIGRANFDEPDFELYNDSTSASIIKLLFLIGDPDFNVDTVSISEGSASGLLVDDVNGNIRADVIELNFTDMDAGGYAAFSAELDEDALSPNEPADNSVNFTDIFFGDLMATALVFFSDGTILGGGRSYTRFNDEARVARHVFDYELDTGFDIIDPDGDAVPLPGAVVFFATALGGLVVRRR